MRDAVYDQLASVEDRLWWHESRRNLVRSFFRKVSLPDNAAALDVGCGTGGCLKLLSEFASRVVGIDMSEHALELARGKHPTAELHQGDANALNKQFQDETFDLVTFFNVLYHEWIEDDADTLRQAWRVLRPGGVILVTDAAFDCLYRRHDRVGMGKRRYTLPAMRDRLEQAGFEWLGGTYFNMVLFLPVWLLALRDRLCPARDSDAPLGELAVPPFPISGAMKFLMTCERAAIRVFGRLPFGVTLLAMARRPDEVGAGPAPVGKWRVEEHVTGEVIHA